MLTFYTGALARQRKDADKWNDPSTPNEPAASNIAPNWLGYPFRDCASNGILPQKSEPQMKARMPESSSDLTRRHTAESAFHDRKYGKGEGYPRHYTVNPTYPIYQRMLALAGNLSNQSVLEYGCGEGWISRDLALAGAKLSAFDISTEAVAQTHKLLATAGVSEQCKIEQMGAEKLHYPDDSFDAAIGFAILHHLDLDMALAELHRVLKPGGVAFFAEPLGTNPLINLYRNLTPQYRTADEKPLDLSALAPMLARFRSVTHSDYYVTALVSVALAYVPFGHRVFPSTNRILMRLDDALLRWFPSLGRLAWYTILTLRK